MAATWLEFLGSLGMLISTAIALIVSLLFLLIITLFYGRNLSVSSLIACNTFLTALTYSSAHFAIAISLLRSDFAVTDGIRTRLYNPFCMSSGFVFYGGCALLYYSYTMEAVQRFSRVFNLFLSPLNGSCASSAHSYHCRLQISYNMIFI
jgi:hypothetical protein